jgi:hypothetical protein
MCISMDICDNLKSNVVPTSIKSLIGKRIEVKWEGEWYPAVLVDASDGNCLVEFEDLSYPDEIIGYKDIRPLPQIKVLRSGEFKHDLFSKFVQSIAGKDVCLFRPTVEQFATAKERTCCQHAKDRIDERFSERLQEFRRSFNTKQDCLFHMEHRYLIHYKNSGFTFSADFTKLISHDYNITWRPSSKNAVDKTKYLPAVIETLCRESIFARCDILRAALKDSCILKTRVKLYTTTTCFILTEDWMRLITCFQHNLKFSDWQALEHRRQARAGKRQFHGQSNKKSNLAYS